MGQVSMFCPMLFHRLSFLLTFFEFANVIRKYGYPHAVKMLFEYLQGKIIGKLPKRGNIPVFEYISLRKFIKKKSFPKITTDTPSMANLRKGR